VRRAPRSAGLLPEDVTTGQRGGPPAEVPAADSGPASAGTDAAGSAAEDTTAAATTAGAPATAAGGPAPETASGAVGGAADPGIPARAVAIGSGADRRTGVAVADLPGNRYFNRELSWLDFNARVLTLAEDPTVPLLERAKFLAIFASNLDEFYMVRVAGLKRRQSTGLSVRSADHLSPREQLVLVADRARALVDRHARCFTEEIEPGLEKEGIRIVHWDDLPAEEQERLHRYFRDHVFPVLTPLAVDPAHPFPYISGLSLNFAVVVAEPDGSARRFARVKVPNNVPRFITIGEGDFLPIEDVIANHLGQLFPGMAVIGHTLFRVTRNADFEVEEDRDEDLLQALERELARRRFGPAVRLEVDESMSPEVFDLLVRELSVAPQDTVRVPGLLDLSSLWALYGVDRPELKDAPFVPASHPRFAEGETPKSVFAMLREGDILVHHPYNSFSTSVQRFVEQAAADPQVLAIKQTLYRTSGDSPVVDALVAAAEAGKQVVVLVEIKARFDEQANISWARALERAGCHVVYGLIGLKTHCKTCLVVREEAGQIRRYSHIGTGNYNPKTARIYEDFGLFTADPNVGADLTDLFNVLTGYSRQTDYRTLLASPKGIRRGIITRIEREIAHARAGRPGKVQMKMNSIVDELTIDALYRASMAGVQIDLVVRGICALRPGLPGLSENIRVRSIVGRFLEHSRLFRFGNAGNEEFWLGSADLMHRNLDRRVEALVRVRDTDAIAQLRHVLDLCTSPSTGGFDLLPDGSWVRRDRALADLQDVLVGELVDEGE
jgi:polyphosphate kinase